MMSTQSRQRRHTSKRLESGTGGRVIACANEFMSGIHDVVADAYRAIGRRSKYRASEGWRSRRMWAERLEERRLLSLIVHSQYGAETQTQNNSDRFNNPS